MYIVVFLYHIFNCVKPLFVIVLTMFHFKVNYMCVSNSLQAIVTELNHAIGAAGVVSQECKAIVEQYGETIINSILSKVSI